MRHDVSQPHKTQELIDYAMQNDYNYFESCLFYLNNQCEQFLYSKLTKYSRNTYEICGKMPIKFFIPNCGDFKQVFQEQINRVPGNYFDYYLIQAVDEVCLKILFDYEIIPFFLEQKRKGLIKQFGLSIQTNPNVFKSLLDLHCWDIVQMPLNAFDYYFCYGKDNYELTEKYHLPVIAQAPVKCGILINEYPFNQWEDNIKQSFAFLKTLPQVKYILCGNSSIDTFRQTIEGFQQKAIYDPKAMQDKLKIWHENNYISCSGCNECYYICPQHIPIRTYFYLFNRSNNKFYFDSLVSLKETLNGEPCNICIGCKQCENICHNKLPIQQLLGNQIFAMRG